MTNIGILGLDTSHAKAFAECLSTLDFEEADPVLTAVWDGGTVRDDDYVADFCAEFGASRCQSPSDMADRVDAAMVLSVDWDRHVDLAEPLLDAGLPTLIDKPVCGSRADLDRLDTVAGATPIFGGSALPYHAAFAAFPSGVPGRTTHLAGFNDYFYYRVHVVDTARRIAGTAWTAVTPLGGTATSTVEVAFEDGQWMTLRFDGSTDQSAFAGLDVAERTRTAHVPATEAELDAMYEPYLGAFLARVHGDTSAGDSILDRGKLALAVETALERGVTVKPGDRTVERPAASFVADYEPYY